MADPSYDKIDIWILVLLTVLVVFIIGFNVCKITNNNKAEENFGDINNYPQTWANPNQIAGIISDNTGNDILETKNKYETSQNLNYSTLNNIPLLVSPDLPSPNQASETSKGYYRVRLIPNSDPESPLLKLEKKYLDKIETCALKKKILNTNSALQINNTFDGYNTYADLQRGSFANVSSIGKSMMTPYTSFPVPS